MKTIIKQITVVFFLAISVQTNAQKSFDNTPVTF